jgi:hypothetical protein
LRADLAAGGDVQALLHLQERAYERSLRQVTALRQRLALFSESPGSREGHGTAGLSKRPHGADF